MKKTSCSVFLAAAFVTLAGGAFAASSSKVDRRDTTSETLKVAATPKRLLGTSSAEPTAVNRFIIKYRGGGNEAQKRLGALQSLANAHARASNKRLSSLGRFPSPKWTYLRSLSSGAMVVTASRSIGSTESAALLAELSSDSSVVYAQPDFRKQALRAVTDDPYLSILQWDLTDPASGVGAPRAWDTSTGEGVIVAVLDTGYLDHRDLTANILPGYDFISLYGQTMDGAVQPDIAGDGDGRDADARDAGDWLDGTEQFCGGAPPSASSWHGTHVAGTVAAVGNNGVGIAGVAYGARVLPVRVLGHCGGYTSDIVDGIVWASGGQVAGVPSNPNPAEVLNLSLAGQYQCSQDPATQDAINGALSRGVTVVVAAGNSNLDSANFSPASCEGVITVGATGSDAQKAYYSNYGAHVALAAPGGNAEQSGAPDAAWIWSLGNSGATTPVPSPEGDVIMGQVGTSMAAPHVAAVVAMMQSASVDAGHGAIPPDLVRAALRATAKPFAQAPPSGRPIGTGILDAAAAVELAARGIQEADLAVALVNRVPTTGQSIVQGTSSLYRLSVPAGRTFTIRTYGGTGDVGLLVNKDVPPTQSTYLGRSDRPGTTEAIALSNVAAGTYYIRVVGVTSSQGLNVLATY